MVELAITTSHMSPLLLLLLLLRHQVKIKFKP
jgi:hypothetical protein